jgi:hypothetical protein
MRAVTRWEVWDDDAEAWRHNHIDDGQVASDVPEARFPSQSGWKRRRWRKTFGNLDDRHLLLLDAS